MDQQRGKVHADEGICLTIFLIININIIGQNYAKGGLAIKSMIVIGALLIMLFGMASASTIHSTFTAINNDSTMMFYSYLKEPRLDESGYTQGYKAGSFNYLVDGDINFADTLRYYDGKIDSAHRNNSWTDHNATLMHKQTVDFEGRKGISEFYAKGFFPSNRAVSAWKKIRYDDLYDYMLGPSAMSSKIKVTAKVGIGPAKVTGMKSDYDFTYHADVEDGALEIWDATGWTNETGARRVDWEQTAFMKGRVLNVTNNLQVEDLFFPGAGAGIDWLPCAICTSVPREQNWPSAATLTVLAPPQKLPYLSRIDNCNASSGCIATSGGSIGFGLIGSEMVLVPNSNSQFDVSAQNRVPMNNCSNSSGCKKTTKGSIGTTIVNDSKKASVPNVTSTKAKSPLVTYATRTAGSPINMGAVRTRSVSMQPAAASGCGVPEGCGVKYNSLPCAYGDCPGFEGIYACPDEGGEPGAGISGIGTTTTHTTQGPDIRVTKEYAESTSNGEQYITYRIEVVNDGGTGLENVTLVDSLPSKLNYMNANWTLEKRGNTEEKPVFPPKMINETGAKTYTNYTWSLGDLGIMDKATIYMRVKKLISAIPTIATTNKAYAWGNWTNSTDNTVEVVKDKTVAVKMRMVGPSPD